MAERLHPEPLGNNDLAYFNDDLLKLSLPDNEQTWLFMSLPMRQLGTACEGTMINIQRSESNLTGRIQNYLQNKNLRLYSLPGHDPNSVVDLSEFLLINSTFSPIRKFSLHTEDDNAKSYTINTRTFTRQRRQYSNGNGKKQITCPNKNINPGGSGRMQEKATILSTPMHYAPVIQIPKVENHINETIDKIEKKTTEIAEQKITPTPELNTNNNNLAAKLSDTSHSLDVSNHTLLVDVSAPNGLMDGTISTSDSVQFLERSYVPFMPKSVSTPSRKILNEEKKKYDINITPYKLDLDNNINNNTIESLANNTYSVLVTNNENNDQNLNVTHIISTSKIEFENTANINEEIKDENILQNTFVLEGSTEEDDMLNANVPLSLPVNYESPLSIKNDTNSKLDELVNIPYETVTDLNSTIIIKSKDIDSEQDSCYSSSSNLRSLGDVCAMSQLQPQKSCNLDSTLKKARSEELLCSVQDIECEVHPEKQHGSALNLSPHKSNQVIGSKRLQKPNYFLKSNEEPRTQPNKSLMETNRKHMGEIKTVATRQLSKIPRPLSRIPKLNLKKA